MKDLWCLWEDALNMKINTGSAVVIFKININKS